MKIFLNLDFVNLYHFFLWYLGLLSLVGVGVGIGVLLQFLNLRGIIFYFLCNKAYIKLWLWICVNFLPIFMYVLIIIINIFRFLIFLYSFILNNTFVFDAFNMENFSKIVLLIFYLILFYYYFLIFFYKNGNIILYDQGSAGGTGTMGYPQIDPPKNPLEKIKELISDYKVSIIITSGIVFVVGSYYFLHKYYYPIFIDKYNREAAAKILDMNPNDLNPNIVSNRRALVDTRILRHYDRIYNFFQFTDEKFFLKKKRSSLINFTGVISRSRLQEFEQEYYLKNQFYKNIFPYIFIQDFVYRDSLYNDFFRDLRFDSNLFQHRLEEEYINERRYQISFFQQLYEAVESDVNSKLRSRKRSQFLKELRLRELERLSREDAEINRFTSYHYVFERDFFHDSYAGYMPFSRDRYRGIYFQVHSFYINSLLSASSDNINTIGLENYDDFDFPKRLEKFLLRYNFSSDRFIFPLRNFNCLRNSGLIWFLKVDGDWQYARFFMEENFMDPEPILKNMMYNADSPLLKDCVFVQTWKDCLLLDDKGVEHIVDEHRKYNRFFLFNVKFKYPFVFLYSWYCQDIIFDSSYNNDIKLKELFNLKMLCSKLLESDADVGERTLRQLYLLVRANRLAYDDHDIIAHLYKFRHHLGNDLMCQLDELIQIVEDEKFIVNHIQLTTENLHDRKTQLLKESPRLLYLPSEEILQKFVNIRVLLHEYGACQQHILDRLDKAKYLN